MPTDGTNVGASNAPLRTSRSLGDQKLLIFSRVLAVETSHACVYANTHANVFETFFSLAYEIGMDETNLLMRLPRDSVHEHVRTMRFRTATFTPYSNACNT